jgi:hypothetical protein
MKEQFLIALMILSASQSVFTQVNIDGQKQVTIERHDKLSSDEKIAKFEFYLKGANRLILEFDDLRQVDSLPDLDSLLNVAWSDLQFLNDTLQDPLARRRLDYVPRAASKRIIFTQYPELSSSFELRNGEIIQLKTRQDTLKIHLFTYDTEKSKLSNSTISKPYYVTLLLNNINDLPSYLQNGLLPRAVKMLKDDLEKNRELINRRLPVYYRGKYNVEGNTVFESVGHALGEQKYSFQLPVAQIGLQYINGYWAPSFGAGIELVKRKGWNHLSSNRRREEKSFQLLWQPYFFFERDSAKSFRVVRNDFITFRYRNSSKDINETSTVQFTQTASFGYLIRRKGDYFGPTTFKFTLPGFQHKSILLEPEFVFNKFFKNFSPSLKLVYSFGED